MDRSVPCAGSSDIFSVACLGDHVVSGGHDKCLRVFKRLQGKSGFALESKYVNAHDHIIHCVSVFSGPSVPTPLVCSGSWDMKVKVFSLLGLDLLLTLEGHKSRVRSLKCVSNDFHTGDGNEASASIPMLLSGGDDGKINCWNLMNGTLLYTLWDSSVCKSNFIIDLDVHNLSLSRLPEEHALITCNAQNLKVSCISMIASCTEKTVTLWCLSTGKQLRILSASEGKSLTCLMFLDIQNNPLQSREDLNDNKLENGDSYQESLLLCLGFSNGSIDVFNAIDGIFLYSLVGGHVGPVFRICDVRNCKSIDDTVCVLTVGQDGYIIFWILSHHEGNRVGQMTSYDRVFSSPQHHPLSTNTIGVSPLSPLYSISSNSYETQDKRIMKQFAVCGASGNLTIFSSLEELSPFCSAAHNSPCHLQNSSEIMSDCRILCDSRSIVNSNTSLELTLPSLVASSKAKDGSQILRVTKKTHYSSGQRNKELNSQKNNNRTQNITVSSAQCETDFGTDILTTTTVERNKNKHFRKLTSEDSRSDGQLNASTPYKTIKGKRGRSMLMRDDKLSANLILSPAYSIEQQGGVNLAMAAMLLERSFCTDTPGKTNSKLENDSPQRKSVITHENIHFGKNVNKGPLMLVVSNMKK